MKTKPIFTGAFLLLGLLSCRKDRMCECTSTNTQTYPNGVTNTSEPSVTKTEYKSVKKKELRVSCADSEYSYSTVSGTTTSSSSGETKCEIVD